LVDSFFARASCPSTMSSVAPAMSRHAASEKWPVAIAAPVTSAAPTEAIVIWLGVSLVPFTNRNSGPSSQ